MVKVKKVFIIDDHYFFRIGLYQFLQSNYEDLFSVNHTTCDLEGLQLVAEKKPDLIFLGLNANMGDTLEVAKQVIRDNPEAGIIAFADNATDKGLHYVYQSGKNGVLLKSDPDLDLDTAIASHITQKKFASKSVLESNMMNVKTKEDLDFDIIYETVLTTREKQMLELIRLGYTNKEVAARLNIEDKTCFNHRYRLMYRFEVKTFPELIRIAQKTANKPSMFKK